MVEVTTLADRLRERATHYRALGEEHTHSATPSRRDYLIVELVLREIADALDDADEEREAA